MTAEQLNRGIDLRDEIWDVEHKIKAFANLRTIYITGGSGNDCFGESITLNEEGQDSQAATSFVSEYRGFLENKLSKLKDKFSKL